MYLIQLSGAHLFSVESLETIPLYAGLMFDARLKTV